VLSEVRPGKFSLDGLVQVQSFYISLGKLCQVMHVSSGYVRL
jgi:hypothetical protein